METIRFPMRYVPSNLTRKDKKTQIAMLLKSKQLYKKHKYYTRKQVVSYTNTNTNTNTNANANKNKNKNKKSNHIMNARRIYNIQTMTPNKELERKTGCSLSALNQIVKKGEGAYYSSGSRPNQTPQSWGLARLASALTAGKAAAVDYDIIDKGCKHNKKAFMLANKSRKKYNHGRRGSPHYTFNIHRKQ